MKLPLIEWYAVAGSGLKHQRAEQSTSSAYVQRSKLGGHSELGAFARRSELGAQLGRENQLACFVFYCTKNPESTIVIFGLYYMTLAYLVICGGELCQKLLQNWCI